MARHTLTKELSITRKGSANNRFNYSEKGLPNSDSTSWRLRLERVFGEGMSRENSSPSSPRGDRCRGLHPAPSQFWRRCGSARIPDIASSFAVCTRRFHGRSMLSVLEATQANALALVGQPWSYLRLKAYSFSWLCEGAYGDFGGSVLTTARGA